MHHILAPLCNLHDDVRFNWDQEHESLLIKVKLTLGHTCELTFPTTNYKEPALHHG